MGSKGKVLEAPVSNQGGAHAQTGRPVTDGNFCRMRIIVDKFLLKLFNNNKEKLKSLIKTYEFSLNDIYKAERVSVKVNSKQLPLRFKVVDLQFHDEDYCRRKNYSPGSLSFRIMIFKARF